MQEADSFRWRCLNAGHAKDVALRTDSTNGPSNNLFPVEDAEREARILATQACRDTPRLGLDPEDLQQRLILEAVKAWPKHQPSLGSPMTYLSGVMRKQVLAEKRRAAALHKREAQINANLSQGLEQRSQPTPASETIAAKELRREAIRALPEEHRFVASLMLDGKSDREIGKQLGAHRGTVNRMRRLFVRIWRERFPDLARDTLGSARRQRSNGKSPGGAP